MVAFSTIPAKPIVGENVLRVKLTDASGGTVKDAVVTFDVTMTMPGMTVMEEKAAVTKDVYLANRTLAWQENGKSLPRSSGQGQPNGVNTSLSP